MAGYRIKEAGSAHWESATGNEENNRSTTVTVDLDTTKEFLDYMNQNSPIADNWKEICEEEQPSMYWSKNPT